MAFKRQIQIECWNISAVEYRCFKKSDIIWDVQGVKKKLKKFNNLTNSCSNNCKF